MKTLLKSRLHHLGLLACAVILVTSVPAPSFAQLTQPVITAIRPQGTNLMVEVSVPAGIRRVTVESRARFGAGAWSPAAVRQTDGTAGTVSFRMSATRQSEMLRVRADPQQPLPDAFYRGTNSFLGPATNSTGLSVGGLPIGVLNGPTPSPAGDSSRAVVESDIWELSGDTLYFFNQYRGLQVIDIKNPDAAFVRGTLALPAAGEQIYLADSNHVILLAANGCAYGSGDSQAIIVAVANGLPQVVTNLPIPGSILESRMVGTALYVASQFSRPVPGAGGSTWEWGTLVSSFDLADPDHPVSRDTLWYNGYGNVVTATDTYLFVVTQDPVNWWRSVIRIIDVTAADGTMIPNSSIRTAGQVQDKFKLNYANGIFTSISEDWHWDNGSVLVTKLETFRLLEPGSPNSGSISKLGELALGNGERLHATRFDTNLAYVVTFFQIDPLWVVDLSDPTQPHIAGSVAVPGWSSYIQPLGPRLVTVGVESNRVAVSLFDVHNPAKPEIVSRLRLGQNYSWSDANSDEKAFTVLSDIGLILVPYNGDTTNGWTSQVQLVDLNPNGLVARGIIQHQSQARRATLSHQRILALSGWELLSVDASDRDNPVVRGDAELAWPVDRLFVHGDYLLELTESTGWWGYQSQPVVRVGPAAQPDQVVGELALDGLPIVGAALKGDRLYLAQSQSWFYPVQPNGPGTNGPNFVVTVVDVGNLPNLSVLGQISTTVDLSGWSGNWEAVWPKPDVLVWVGGGRSFWWLAPTLGPVAGGGSLSGGLSTGLDAMFWPFWGFGGGQLLAFDVSDAAAPVFDSEVNLSTNGWWSFSEPFSTGTLVYLSHSASEWVPTPTDPQGLWVQRSCLDVIDYADPLSPTVRDPVNIPGTLHGLSHGGDLLFTVGIHWTNQLSDWTEWLDSSAYDGVAAHLVASLVLPGGWPHPLLVVNTNVYIGRPGDSVTSNTIPAKLETWSLPDSGIFTSYGSLKLAMPASTLVERGGLLTAQETDSSVDLFDDSSTGPLRQVGRGQPSGCLWFDLNQGDGALGRGLWIPLGAYGVGQISAGR
jgi:hypothetical protein